MKLTRLYGLGIGASYALILLVLTPQPAGSITLWVNALTTASWVAGVGALSLARDLAERDRARGLTALARLRGFDETLLERARTAAGALRLSSAVALAGSLVALAALVRGGSFSAALAALALALLSLPYAALLGVTLALLARLSSHLLPRHGRLLFCALVLAPWLLAHAFKSPLPSVPAAFGWLLARLSGSLR